MSINFVRRSPSHRYQRRLSLRKRIQRTQYEHRRMNNLCTACGKEKTEEDQDFVACAACREYNRRKHVQHCLDKGLPQPVPRLAVRAPRKKRLPIEQLDAFTTPWKKRFRGQKVGLPNAGKDWTAEQDNMLVEMLDKRTPIEEMCAVFGRSESALIRRSVFIGRDDLKRDNFRSPYAHERMKKW